MNQLIHCVTCHALFMKTPFDREPEYTPPPLSSGFIAFADKDDFKEFMTDHQGHQFEHLAIVEDSCVSSENYIEPVKVSYFRATNGKDWFVIRRFRDQIDEPLRYELVDGDYELKLVCLQAQSKDIKRQIAAEFKGQTFPKEKIDSLLRLFKHIVKTVDVKNLERVREESAHPLERYYKMDDITLMVLLGNCQTIFKGQEYSQIEKFIRRHKDDGVFLLKASFQLNVFEKAKTQKTSPTPSFRQREKISGRI